MLLFIYLYHLFFPIFLLPYFYTFIRPSFILHYFYTFIRSFIHSSLLLHIHSYYIIHALSNLHIHSYIIHYYLHLSHYHTFISHIRTTLFTFIIISHIHTTYSYYVIYIYHIITHSYHIFTLRYLHYAFHIDYSIYSYAPSDPFIYSGTYQYLFPRNITQVFVLRTFSYLISWYLLFFFCIYGFMHTLYFRIMHLFRCRLF